MHPATQRVVAAAAERGLSIDVVEFAQSTRTAQAATDAIGCDVAQIVKKPVFYRQRCAGNGVGIGCQYARYEESGGRIGYPGRKGQTRRRRPSPRRDPDSPSVVCRPSAMQNR